MHISSELFHARDVNPGMPDGNLVSKSPTMLRLTIEGRRHRAWPGKQKLKVAELRIVSCFVQKCYR